MFKAFRIITLLLILATVAQQAWLARTRATRWENSLHVGIYPIVADASEVTRRHVAGLHPESFRTIDAFFAEETARHGLTIQRPVVTQVAPPVLDLPPPAPVRTNAIEAIVWSLRLRWWVWRHDRIDGPKPAVRLFVLFYDPANHPRLAHSTGIEPGMIGVIHAYASPRLAGSNAVIIAHELLHTLGATDKYDPATNLPLHPQGYADPARQPRFPQDFAEIMGGRIPLSPTQADIPPGLAWVVVGPATAREIRWLRPAS